MRLLNHFDAKPRDHERVIRRVLCPEKAGQYGTFRTFQNRHAVQPSVRRGRTILQIAGAFSNFARGAAHDSSLTSQISFAVSSIRGVL